MPRVSSKPKHDASFRRDASRLLETKTRSLASPRNQNTMPRFGAMPRVSLKPKREAETRRESETRSIASLHTIIKSPERPIIYWQPKDN